MTDTPEPRAPGSDPARDIIGAPTIYLFLFLCGVATMGVELTAVRLLAPHFGTSTIVWTNVICVILVALSFGFLAGGAVADRRPDASALSALSLAAGLVLLVVPVVGPWVATEAVPDDVPIESGYASLLASSLVVAAALFAPPVFLLGATTPVAYRLLVRDLPRAGRRLGVGATAATFGGIAGTYLPTLWLVPWLGTRRTLWAMAVVALVAAAIARLGARRAAAAAGAAAVGYLLSSGSPGRIGDAPIEERETRYQYLAVREAPDGARTLTANEGRTGFQSAFVPGQVLSGGRYFDLFNVFAAKASAPGGPLRVLVLGFAGGTAAREIVHFFSPDRDVRIDGVEIDPAAVDLGRRHLGLAEGVLRHVRLFHEDARTFVNRGPGPYELAIVDVYAHDVFIPFQIASLEFFEALRRALAPEGLLVVNASVFVPDAPPLDRLASTVARAFGEVARYPIEHSQNVLLVAAKSGQVGPILLSRPALPPGLEGVGRAFRPDRCRVIPADALVEPLTDDRSPLEMETDALLRRLSRSIERSGP